MKNIVIGIYILTAFLICLITASCENKKTTMKTNNKDQMDAATETIKNMQTAYKGEKTATAKYEAFAIKAEEDGYHNIAILYNAVSAAENIHANNHKAVIEDSGSRVPVISPEFTVKSTKENLFDDINGEAYEAKTMYPNFLKTAEIAENQIAHLSLSYAMKTELKHKIFFEQALDDIINKNLNNLPTVYYVCPACGNTYTKAPKHCDFSLTDSEKFIIFK